jgi:hypothetical protein
MKIATEKMTDAQIEFANDLANQFAEISVEIDSLDILDSLARLGLELHPISDEYGMSTSIAYQQELQNRVSN